jgi:hypothetical protein
MSIGCCSNLFHRRADGPEAGAKMGRILGWANDHDHLIIKLTLQGCSKMYRDDEMVSF